MFFLKYVEDSMPVVKLAASVHIERSDSASILSALQKGSMQCLILKTGWARL